MRLCILLSTEVLWKRYVDQIVATDTRDTNVNNQTSEQVIGESLADNLSQSAVDVPILSPSSPPRVRNVTTPVSTPC